MARRSTRGLPHCARCRWQTHPARIKLVNVHFRTTRKYSVRRQPCFWRKWKRRPSTAPHEVITCRHLPPGRPPTAGSFQPNHGEPAAANGRVRPLKPVSGASWSPRCRHAMPLHENLCTLLGCVRIESSACDLVTRNSRHHMVPGRLGMSSAVHAQTCTGEGEQS